MLLHIYIFTLSNQSLTFDNYPSPFVNDLISSHTIGLIIYCIAILTLSSVLFIIFRSAQQGSQFVLSMLIAISVLFPSLYPIPVFSSLFIALCISYSQISLDSANFFVSHFWNRINEIPAYIRTYGKQKYKFFSFDKKNLKNFIVNLLSFDIDPATEKNHGRYKSSWFSQLLENRSFVYSGLLLFLCFIVSMAIIYSLLHQLSFYSLRSFLVLDHA